MLQEAHEKAFEELVLGLKDFENEKSRIYNEKKEVLNEEFDKRTKEKMAAKRIQKSSLINSSRMEKMQARHRYQDCYSGFLRRSLKARNAISHSKS